MNTQLKRTFGFCISIFFSLLLITSCGKKWKKPADVAFSFKISSSNSNSLIKFASGHLLLQQFNFSGSRKQGQNDVSLSRNFSGGLLIPFSTTTSSSMFTFDIPQGTYTDFNMGFVLSEDNVSHALVMNGNYVNLNNDTIPVIFQFKEDENISIKGKAASGGDILLMEDKPSVASITFDPHYWFATITQNMLENAELILVDNVPTILVTDSDNEDIYELVISRLKDNNQATVD